MREYERYYTDRTVAVRDRGGTLHKRIADERLVYAEVFPL